MANNSSKFLKIFSYILPDYNPADKEHNAINIPAETISHCSITTSTNNLLVSARIIFSDISYSIIVPYLSHKYPPVVLINVSEILRDAEADSTTIIRDVFKHAFLIDNIKFNATTNRTYSIELRLVSAHATVFKMFSSYSNHNIPWEKLNVSDDLNAIFKSYTNSTGCSPKFVQSDDVFGVKPDTLHRRYATANNTLLTDAVLDIVGQLYEPALNERLISDTYKKAVGNTVATKLVGYTIDTADNSPVFFRLNTDEDYSVETTETQFTKKLISLRFNGATSVDNQCATVALPLNSSYMSMMREFSINERFVYYDQFMNGTIVSTVPNRFKTICDVYFHEDTSILSDAKSLYVKSDCTNPPKVPPPMPIVKSQYNINTLNSFVQRYDYSGCNTTHNRYAKLMHETLTNNIIYLNITHSIGHKVGQVIDLIVKEFGGNNAEHNYNLNLAFSGKWKIVACNWELNNTGPVLQYSETLSLTRFGILTPPVSNQNTKLQAINI